MVSKQKIELVDSIVTEIGDSNVIGIVGINGIPGSQMNEIRKELRGKAKLIVAKNSIIMHVLERLEEKNKNITSLKEYLRDQCGIIFSQENPFKLNKIIEKSRTTVAPKGGEIAPNDIVVSAGETDFKPGPIVSDMQKVGIPAAIEKGKVVIKKDTVVVKKGEKISRDLALILQKLDIRPLPVGLDVKAIYEGGYIFKPDVLHIDEEKIKLDIMNSVRNAFNLAMNAKYFTPMTTPLLISKAYMDALSLGVSANYFAPETIKHLLAKANMQAMYIKSKIGEI